MCKHVVFSGIVCIFIFITESSDARMSNYIGSVTLLSITLCDVTMVAKHVDAGVNIFDGSVNTVISNGNTNVNIRISQYNIHTHS